MVGNRVYLSTARIEWGGGEGAIVCLDADTGTLIWKSAPAEYEATFSSPSISGDYLVVGEGLHTTKDAKVVCMSLASGSEGEILWSYQTQSHVESTPVIYDGMVYVGAGDKEGYYCFDIKGDGSGNPKVIWHKAGEDYLDAETSLAASDGKFYAGLGNDGKAIVEFDARTGEELRRIKTAYPVFSPPAIADGKMYVGSGNGDFALTAAQLGLPSEGELLCVDLKTFSVDWRYATQETILGAVAVRDGKVFFACRNGELVCLDVEGALDPKLEPGLVDRDQPGGWRERRLRDPALGCTCRFRHSHR